MIIKKKPAEYKQAILVRADLGMSKGKLAVQAAHASVTAVLRVQEQDRVLNKDTIKTWNLQGMKKVVLKVANKEELFKYKTEAEKAGLKCAVVKDAGLTEIAPGTYTALAIGPEIESKIDKLVGKLLAL